MLIADFFGNSNIYVVKISGILGNKISELISSIDTLHKTNLRICRRRVENEINILHNIR